MRDQHEVAGTAPRRAPPFNHPRRREAPLPASRVRPRGPVAPRMVGSCRRSPGLPEDGDLLAPVLGPILGHEVHVVEEGPAGVRGAAVAVVLVSAVVMVLRVLPRGG